MTTEISPIEIKVTDPLAIALGIEKLRGPSPTGWYDMNGRPMTEEDMKRNAEGGQKVVDAE